jgi:conjugative transposon TraN protein
MKQVACLVCAFLLIRFGFAQRSLSITTDKTSSLIFPFPILHIDRGTKDILVKEVKESDHILLLKAGCRKFPPTNLSVLTGDGSLYSFLVSYDSLPLTLVYRVAPQLNVSVETRANSIMDNEPFLHGPRDKSWGMQTKLSGIYIHDNVIYYQLSLDNDSPIDYDIDYIRFYVRDKLRSKRTARQEIELKPIHITGNVKQVRAGAHSVLVVALEKFTVPDAKVLAIEIGEGNGGRNLLLKVNNRKIVKARVLPDLN